MARITNPNQIGMQGFSTEIIDAMWFKKKKCKNCGKTVWIDPMLYQWKHMNTKGNRTMWYCSYSCWRVEDRRRRDKEAKEAERLMKEAAACGPNGELKRPAKRRSA